MCGFDSRLWYILYNDIPCSAGNIIVKAEVVELVDTHVSGACVRKDMGVRVPPSAQKGEPQPRFSFFLPGWGREIYPAILVMPEKRY